MMTGIKVSAVVVAGALLLPGTSKALSDDEKPFRGVDIREAVGKSKGDGCTDCLTWGPYKPFGEDFWRVNVHLGPEWGCSSDPHVVCSSCSALQSIYSDSIPEYAANCGESAQLNFYPFDLREAADDFAAGACPECMMVLSSALIDELHSLIDAGNANALADVISQSNETLWLNDERLAIQGRACNTKTDLHLELDQHLAAAVSRALSSKTAKPPLETSMLLLAPLGLLILPGARKSLRSA